MRKSIFMYSLFAFGYFVFSTLPWTEASAQTITIISGNNQSTTRGSKFTQPVVFRVAGVAEGTDAEATFLSTPLTFPIEISQNNQDFSDNILRIENIANGDYPIYVQAKSETYSDTCGIWASLVVGGKTEAEAFFKGDNYGCALLSICLNDTQR